MESLPILSQEAIKALRAMPDKTSPNMKLIVLIVDCKIYTDDELMQLIGKKPTRPNVPIEKLL
jgi:hypothetical protein